MALLHVPRYTYRYSTRVGLVESRSKIDDSFDSSKKLAVRLACSHGPHRKRTASASQSAGRPGGGRAVLCAGRGGGDPASI